MDRRLVVDHLKLNYEGLFNAAEVYNVISSWFFEKGWDWYERINDEQVTPNGKFMRLVLEPWKSTTEFYKLMMKLKVHMSEVKEVEVDHEGETLRMHHGIIHITFDGYVASDRQGEWVNKPLTWFLTIILEKYFFRSHSAKLDTWIKSDVDDLHHKIKNYLNMFKYTYQQ